MRLGRGLNSRRLQPCSYPQAELDSHARWEAAQRAKAPVAALAEEVLVAVLWAEGIRRMDTPYRELLMDAHALVASCVERGQEIARGTEDGVCTLLVREDAWREVR